MQQRIVEKIVGVLLSTVLATFGGCLTGCVKPMTWEQQKQMITEVKAFAEQSGAAATITIGFGPRIGLYEEAAIGIDTGVKMQASLLFNSACARSPRGLPDPG